jgi:hypothetical protein
MITTLVGGPDEPPDEEMEALRRLDEALIEETASRSTPSWVDATATLRMPLGRYVDSQGTEVILAEVRIEVAVDRAGVLDRISGQRPDASPVRVVSMSHELTDTGREAVEALRTLQLLVPGLLP